jgi:hypothetical protein
MRRIRRIGAAAALAPCAGLFWACSSFDADSSRSSLPDGAAMAADASPGDAAGADASTSPCPRGIGTVSFTSSFGTPSMPSLVGWTPGASPAGNEFVATASDGKAIGRGTIAPGTTGPSYAVALAPIETSFAGRFSFAMQTLVDGYVVHQAIAPTGANLTFALQARGFTVEANGASVLVGDRGAAGAWHTLRYAFERVAPNEAALKVTFDGDSASLSIPGTSTYTGFQLGPYWVPPGGSAAPITVDYADVTIWDCSR